MPVTIDGRAVSIKRCPEIVHGQMCRLGFRFFSSSHRRGHSFLHKPKHQDSKQGAQSHRVVNAAVKESSAQAKKHREIPATVSGCSSACLAAWRPGVLVLKLQGGCVVTKAARRGGTGGTPISMSSMVSV